jgi:hypothetical protein
VTTHLRQNLNPAVLTPGSGNPTLRFETMIPLLLGVEGAEASRYRVGGGGTDSLGQGCAQYTNPLTAVQLETNVKLTNPIQ